MRLPEHHPKLCNLIWYHWYPVSPLLLSLLQKIKQKTKGAGICRPILWFGPLLIPCKLNSVAAVASQWGSPSLRALAGIAVIGKSPAQVIRVFLTCNELLVSADPFCGAHAIKMINSVPNQCMPHLQSIHNYTRVYICIQYAYLGHRNLHLHVKCSYEHMQIMLDKQMDQWQQVCRYLWDGHALKIPERFRITRARLRAIMYCGVKQQPGFVACSSLIFFLKSMHNIFC